MKENYSELCSFNFGKRCYVVIKNSNKVIYFERVNDKYVMPITSFDLYDNEGKSMTLVNEHFFMNQLVSRINIALGKGYFVNDVEIIDYLSGINSSIEGDVNLKKILKGSLMSKIDVDNFEFNKKRILDYIDKFKIETYVDYNNVSVFNGSLSKNIVNDVDVNNFNFSSDTYDEIVDDDKLNVEVSNDLANDSELVNDEKLDFEISDEIVDNSKSYDEIVDDEVIEIDDIDSKNVVLNDSVNFSSNDFEEIIDDDIISDTFNKSDNENVDFIVDNVSSSLNNNDVDDFNMILSDIGNFSSSVSESDNNVLNNQLLEPVIDNLPNDSLASNQVNEVADFSNNYIDEVKNRIVSSSSFDSNGSFVPNENVDLKNKVISDKNDLPEIGDDQGASDVKKKKGKGGIVLFFIILIAFLVVISYLLYMYVF